MCSYTSVHIYSDYYDYILNKGYNKPLCIPAPIDFQASILMDETDDCWDNCDLGATTLAASGPTAVPTTVLAFLISPTDDRFIVRYAYGR